MKRKHAASNELKQFLPFFKPVTSILLPSEFRLPPELQCQTRGKSGTVLMSYTVFFYACRVPRSVGGALKSQRQENNGATLLLLQDYVGYRPGCSLVVACCLDNPTPTREFALNAMDLELDGVGVCCIDYTYEVRLLFWLRSLQLDGMLSGSYYQFFLDFFLDREQMNVLHNLIDIYLFLNS